MHAKALFSTTLRILQQLAHDPRTLALLFLVPCILLALLAWLFSDNERMFDSLGPALLGVFPFVVMFLVTSVTTLRERTTGTLERLMVLPVGKLDILLGYATAFGLLAIIQAVFAGFTAIYLLGLDVAGPEWFLLLVAVANALLGMALGLFVSAFARTEFQAVQFLPAIILPQFLLCGLIVSLSDMPGTLEAIAYLLPLTYAVDAMQAVAANEAITDDAWRDLVIIACWIVAVLVLGAVTLRRHNH